MKGKNYANRKPLKERPEADFYSTPISLVWELNNRGILPDKSTVIYEPASGGNAIVNSLQDMGFSVVKDDIRTTKKDFLDCTDTVDCIVTNPPFSLFDDFVLKAKEVSPLVIMIAKTNFFGAYKRNQMGVWENLRDVYIFNRQVDYRTPHRQDGHFHVGNLITGWFVWDRDWTESYWRTHIMDVQQYATLGGIK